MKPFLTLTLIGTLGLLGPLAAADEAAPHPTVSSSGAPAEQLATTPAAMPRSGSVRPDLAAEARAFGAQLGALELATWRLVAAGGDSDDAVVAAVKAHLAGQRARLKSAIAGSSAVRCSADASGETVSLRVRTTAATEAYREAYAAASGDLAAIKEKMTSAEATRAVATRVTEEESAFRVGICREILAEQAALRTPVPIVRRGQGPVADS